MQTKLELSSLIASLITMASNSELLLHGYEELSNVMQELKEWTASLIMLSRICNKKGEFLTTTYDDVNILQFAWDRSHLHR